MNPLPDSQKELMAELIELRQRNTQLESYNLKLLQANGKLKEANNYLVKKFSRQTLELFHQQQRLFDVMDTLPVNIALFTPEYQVAFCNRTFRNRYGDAQGHRCYEYINGRDKPCDFCQSFTVLETGRPHQWDLVAKDGSYLNIYNFPFTDVDGSTSVLEMSIDVTEKKKMVEELRQSEERFHNIFQKNPDLKAIVRMKDNIILDVNQKFLDCLEYSRDEIMHMDILKLGILDNDLDLARSALLELEENNEVNLAELKLRTKMGKNIIVSSSTVTMNLNGEPCRVTQMRDITQEKKLEAEMERLDRLNMIGQMAASISHEIRNPLTSVRGFLQMLRSLERFDEEAEYFDIMIDEIDRANQIISVYLGMARDKLLILNPVSLDAIIKSIFPMILSDANHREINIVLELGSPPVLLLYENEIRQLILNLVRNGMEAMTSHGNLTIGTLVQGGDVVLFIRDQGPGIAPEVADKMGTPFLTTKESGTGLGLPVCYSIAARHQARIDFETGPNGTVFFVRFPLTTI